MNLKKVFLFAMVSLLAVAMLAGADEAKRFKLVFDDAYLIYVPAKGTLQIVSSGNVLSYGKDWKVKKMKPYLYAFKNKMWKGFFWKVNTSRGEVYMIRGVAFGKMGGDSKTLDGIKIKNFGDAMKPDRFQLLFDEAYMAYLPETKTKQIVTSGVVLSYCNDWYVKMLKPYLFHFKQKVWKGFYWHVNSSRKEVHRVRNGKFGKMGGDLQKLNIAVELY